MGIQRPNISGNATTATKLQTARTIGGVSFNGTANINLPGVNTPGNQDTLGKSEQSAYLAAFDNREISPSESVTQRVQAVFTTWTNTAGTSPYADGLLFNTYTDDSGGRCNLLALRKDVLGLRIYQQNFGVDSKFTEYKDVAWNDGTNAVGTWNISIGGTAGGVSTAGALNATAGADVGSVGTYAMLRNFTSNQILPGQTEVAANLSYANAAGIAGGNPPAGSVWRCMGYASSNSEFPNKDMATTLWLRIS